MTPPLHADRSGHRAFAALVAAYVCVWLWYVPVTYAIDDEANIVSLALALSHGTPFLDHVQVSLDADLEWRGHRVSKFSPFHAILLSPAIATDWRLGFIVAPAFFLVGAFVFRGMLRRHGLSDAWTTIYFLQPGMLYYSRTLLAVVPAAVMGLVGASLLLRDRPRPAAAGLALGAAVLLHIWLAPVAMLLAATWWLERARGDSFALGRLILGALPAILLMGFYNFVVTGHPLLTPYWILNHHLAFDGRHFFPFLGFYVAALAVAPVAGWAALSRRHAGTWSVPITCTGVVVLAAAYYFRDGAEYGAAGWVPGLRFLLPVSVLACLPAARWLSARVGELRLDVTPASQVAAVAAFTCGFWLLSTVHQRYLGAHAAVQAEIRRAIPDGAHVVANPEAFKIFAPVNGRWQVRIIRDGRVPAIKRLPGAYRVWLGRPGERPSAAWFDHPSATVTHVRAMTWARTLWVARPAS